MDIVGRKVESQVQFWSLLGPFFVLLSIAVLLFKVSPHWYFPVSALIGIPLCVKWKMKGMAAALCCLFLLAGVSYQNLELDDRYWHVGLSLTMAFSFIVLTLSLEEAQGLVNKLQLESQSRLDNFLLLDEKWKVAEQGWALEKEKAKNEITTLTQEIVRVQEEKQTFYKLAQLAKDELMQVRNQHDPLLQDLLYKKQQIAQLHERLEETELTIQGFVNSDSEKQVQNLTEHITCLDREKEIFQAKLTLAQEEREAYEQEKLEMQAVLQCLKELEEEKGETEEELVQARQDLEVKNEVLVQMQEKVNHLSNELCQQQSFFKQSTEQNQRLEQMKLHLEQLLHQTQIELGEIKQKQQESNQYHEKLPYAPGNTRQIETMYLQLKEQFQEKCEVLNATRREFFHVSEELLKCKKQYEELSLFGQSVDARDLQQHLVQLGREFEQMQGFYQQEIDELTLVVECLLRQMNTH